MLIMACSSEITCLTCTEPTEEPSRLQLMSGSSVPIKEGMVEKRGHNARYLMFSKYICTVVSQTF